MSKENEVMQRFALELARKDAEIRSKDQTIRHLNERLKKADDLACSNFKLIRIISENMKKHDDNAKWLSQFNG